MAVISSTGGVTNEGGSGSPQHPSFVPPELPEALLADASSRRLAACNAANADGAGAAAHHPDGLLGAPTAQHTALDELRQPWWAMHRTGGAAGPNGAADDLSQLVGEQKRRSAKMLEQRLQLDVAALEQRSNHRKERLRYQASLEARRVMEKLDEILRSEEAALDGELEANRRSLERNAAAERLDLESRAARLTLAEEARKLQSKMAARSSPRLEVPSLVNFAVREGLRGKAAAALVEKPTDAEFVEAAAKKDLPSRIAEAKGYGVDAGLVAEAEERYTHQVLTGFHALRAQERLLQAMNTGHSDMPGLPPFVVPNLLPPPRPHLSRQTTITTTRRILRKKAGQYVGEEAGSSSSSLPSTAASSEPEDDFSCTPRSVVVLH